MFRPTLLAVTIAIGAMVSVTAVQAATTLPLVKIAQVITNDDSAKIYITPISGAADYRIYDRANPHFVKYAGGAGGSAFRQVPRWNSTLGKFIYTERSLPCIEFNGMDPNKAYNLVVEALDAPGPYEEHTASMTTPMVCNCPVCNAPSCPCGCVMNINGHGTSTARP